MRTSYRDSDGWWTINGPKNEALIRRGWYVVIVAVAAFIIALTGFSAVGLMPTIFAASAQGTWEPANRVAVVASEDGIVTAHTLLDGDLVNTGDIIATMDLPEVDEQLRTVEHLRKEHASAAREQESRRQLDKDDAAAKLETLANEHATLRSTLKAKAVEFLDASRADSAIDAYELGKHSSLDPIVRDIKGVEREIDLTRNRLMAITQSRFLTDLALDKVQLAESRMEILRKRFDAKEMRARIAGGVVYRKTAASLPYLAKANDTIAEIVDRRGWLVRLALSEQSLLSLRENDTVTIIVPEVGDGEKRTVSGYVVKIGTLPDPNNKIQVVYRVDIAVAKGALTEAEMEQIRPGYSTQVRMKYRPKTVVARFFTDLRWSK